MRMNDFYRAESIDDAYSKLLDNQDNIIIGGGAWLKLTNKSVNLSIDLENCSLKYIKDETDFIEIGSLTTLYEVEQSKIVNKLASGIVNKAISKIMGVGIKNIATIGGSVMGKFSFSDLLTPLLVLDTRLVFHKKGEIKLEDFINTKKTDKDILVAIKIKKEEMNGFFKKVSKTALDFALVNIAISKGSEIKIAIGARPSISVLAIDAMNVINNGEINDKLITEAVSKIDLIKFSKNAKASKEYRLSVAKTYVKRGLKEVIGL